MRMSWIVVIAILLGTATAPAARQDNPVLEEFSAILTNISNVGGTGLTPLTIRIRRWTGDEEHERLMGTLREKGQRAFLDALLDGKAVGSIATPTSLKYDFFYARQSVDKEGGRRIMLISDRPMTPMERASAARSRDYPFTVIDLRLDSAGNGEGTLAQLVQLRLSGNILGIENLATSPMKLSEVKKRK
jgi:hypothetical protein